MTTLTDEQARELALEIERAVREADGKPVLSLPHMETVCMLCNSAAKLANYILSRPSLGVQPISEDWYNAGQPGGAAHAGRALLDADGRLLEKFQYICRRYQDGRLRDDDTNWLMNTVGDLLNRLTAQQEKK